MISIAHPKIDARTLLALSILVGGWPTIGLTIEPPQTTVPPTLEIEVLSPGVDPLDHPAVRLRDGSDSTVQQVDVLATVLVHRYYYTGDRDFQAQLLPGGPSILVVHDPITNQKRYVQIQLPPGAPRVRYTGRSIEYDYGFSSVKVKFGRFGAPKVHYRSGTTMTKKLSQAFRADEIKVIADRLSDATKQASSDVTTAIAGSVLFAGDGVLQVFSPVTGWLESGPLSGLNQRFETRVQQHKAEPLLNTSRRETEYVDRFPG